MRRYYVCRLVEVNDPEFGVTMVPRLAQIAPPEGASRSFVYDAQRAGFAICVVTHPHGLPAIVDPDVETMPDFPLDAKLNAMQQATRDRMIARCQAFGVSTAHATQSDGFRDFLQGVGAQVSPDFRLDGFGVAG